MKFKLLLGVLRHAFVALVGAFIGIVSCFCWFPVGGHWGVMVPLTLPVFLLAGAIRSDNPIMLWTYLVIPYWAIMGMVIALLLYRRKSRVERKRGESREPTGK